MMGTSPNQGYSRGAEIFLNVKAMRAKEVVAKGKETTINLARHAYVSKNIVHKLA